MANNTVREIRKIADVVPEFSSDSPQTQVLRSTLVLMSSDAYDGLFQSGSGRSGCLLMIYQAIALFGSNRKKPSD